jgi:hypothetical protein
MNDDENDRSQDTDDEAEAAKQHEGQDQEPKQAQEESSTAWDTEEHSDAPGPFGTGDE